MRGIIYGLHSGDGLIRYVGRTIAGAERRLRQHRWDAERGSAYPVHRWMRKQGLDSIVIEVLDETDEADLGATETIWIEWAQNSFPGQNLNILLDGYFPKPVTAETAALISAAHSGRKFSVEHRERISAALLGHSVSEETREKLRGKGCSEETRAKLSAAMTGRRLTEEHKAKLRIKPSEETRRKLSEAGRRRRHSAETKAKISASAMGRHQSVEARARISAAAKARGSAHLLTRRCCIECGLVSTPGALGRHQKASGHSGTKVAV